jgi:hypothetical protein
VDTVVIVALAGITPVENVDASVWPIGQVDAAKPGVLGEEDIGLMPADGSAPLALEPLDVHPPAVEVEGEQLAAIFRRPLVGQVDHQPAVGVAAAAPAVVGPDLAAVGQGPGVVPVVVIGVLVDQGVGPRVRLDGVRAGEVGARDQVPEVAVDRIDEERLAQRVPVVAPGVGGPVGQHLEPLPGRVIAPEPAPHGHAPVRGRAGDADLSGGRRPAPSVEPAIGPPSQAVGEGVMVLRGHAEAVEHDLGGPVGTVVAVAVGDEKEPRWAEQPDAAETELDAGEPLDLVGEDRPTIGLPVLVRVLEDEHPIAEAEVEPIGLIGVRIVLGDPEPAAAVPGHGDRVLDVGLGGEDADAEPLRRPEAGGGLRRRQRPRGRRLGISRSREIVGRGPGRHEGTKQRRERE